MLFARVIKADCLPVQTPIQEPTCAPALCTAQLQSSHQTLFHEPLPESFANLHGALRKLVKNPHYISKGWNWKCDDIDAQMELLRGVCSWTIWKAHCLLNLPSRSFLAFFSWSFSVPPTVSCTWTSWEGLLIMNSSLFTGYLKQITL